MATPVTSLYSTEYSTYTNKMQLCTVDDESTEIKAMMNMIVQVGDLFGYEQTRYNLSWHPL